MTAMTAELLTISVSAAVARLADPSATQALISVPGMIVSMSQRVAPVLWRAEPIAMAPPYMSATPQLT